MEASHGLSRPRDEPISHPSAIFSVLFSYCFCCLAFHKLLFHCEFTKKKSSRHIIATSRMKRSHLWALRCPALSTPSHSLQIIPGDRPLVSARSRLTACTNPGVRP
ncbi:hypothetical protein AOQ84DRAFT_61648 [Glonium stellatum]|uniref:Uncharacterized protein n=1 Tax=Glonium stellatum TaxID=574774 RepID=A0A8E2EYI8_9PEZI|nr:hypothetical protein AOQ84DRAFT_61648 [Glonium stellatum]